MFKSLDSFFLKKRLFRIAGACAVLLAANAVSFAGPQNETVNARLTGLERLQFDSLKAMDARTLDKIADRVEDSRLEKRTRELLELDVPAIGSRSVDDEGLSPIHHYIMNAAARQASNGLELVGTMRKQVAAPVDLDRLLNESVREEYARLEFGDESIRIYPLWPNGAMPSLVPRDGLEGPLVYCGGGSWEDLNGKGLDGAIALLGFRGAQNLERLFSLGVKAVIVMEDEYVQYETATSLLTQTPSPFPRFYVEGSVKDKLIALTEGAVAGPVVKVHGGQVYEDRPVESLFYRLPAADATQYTVTDSLLFNWIAAEYGVNASELRNLNGLEEAIPGPGKELKIPGSSKRFTVPADGLWEMVARINDVDTAALKAANPDIADKPLIPRMTLSIPSGKLPLAVFVAIDTASVVPGLPHGALAMANVAAALELMEFLCESQGLRLRRDVIFGFIDGDTLGGQASRLVAEYSYLLENEFGGSTATQASGDDILQNYLAGAEWFEGGAVPGNSSATRWLLNEWIKPRFEEKRILLAENRIARIVGSHGSELLPPQDVIEADLARIAALRDSTILGFGSDAERLERLWQAWSGPESADLQRFGLGKDELQDRFSRELTEIELGRMNHAHNLATARKLREATLGAGVSGNNSALAWKLDLGDASPFLGLNMTAKGSLRIRNSLMGAELFKSLSPRMRKVAAYAASKAGWSEDFTFISEEDRAALSLTESPAAVLYDEFWIHADFTVLPLSGESDRRNRVDTPADNLDNINWDNFSLQARTAMTLLVSGLESLLDTRVQKRGQKPDLSRVGGKTVQFNIRSGIDAKDPVPGTYVFQTMAKGDSGFAERNTEMFFGYRRGVVQKTLLNGSYLMPPESINFNSEPRIYAYKLDRNRALFTKVATQGQVGTKPQRNQFKQRIGEVVEKNLVLIDVYPRVIFLGSNPSSLKQILGGSHNTNVMELVDAVINGSPRDYAIDNPIVDFHEKEREAVTLYMPEEDRVRVTMQSGLDYAFIITGPVETAESGEAQGRGILIGPDNETGDRNTLLPLTPFHIAKGMWRLAENRLNIYQQYGISSKPLREAVDRSGEFLEQAELAIEQKDWQKAIGNSRVAWGILVKNFPRVLKLGREAVFSVILLMALAVPGAWFLERLIIGSKGIVARLGGITAIFIAATVFLNFFHPAFKIALSPFIIVIAFTMILMSVIVIALSYGRFEVVLRQFRSAGGEIQSEEITLMSSLATAFSLGISNLKKRTFRTALTVFTVIVLTFSIVAFVAVKGKDALTRIAQPLDNTVEGHTVDPIPPAYNGLLIRSDSWRGMSSSKVSALVSEFGADFEVTRRGHYMEQEGGNGANREGVNQILVRFGNAEAVVNALSLMEPNEPDFSGLNRTVSHETWFRGADLEQHVAADRFSVILPDNVAGILGIEAEMLVDSAGRRLPDEELPVVTMMNQDWKVIGILDTDLANRIRDVNGKSLSVVDFLKSGMSTNTSPGELVTEGPSYHMDWKRLAIIPYEALRDVQGQPRSVAVNISPEINIDTVLQDMSMRLKTEFFAAKDGDVFMVVPRAKVDFAGVAKVFLPVILCILIVMNTMLGTVEERKGEVGMLGAIGLSPRQIAFLMFSEATVFSVLGIILGTFGGLLFSNIINSLNAGGGSVLTGLSFNFTSMISMLLATGTGLVVLAATLIPANKAAALAAPSGMTEWELPESGPGGEIDFRLPFTLTRGNAVGMAAFFNQFLINHNEATSEDFNCREVSIKEGKKGGNPFIEIRTDMWLAPYDLDVAQHFTLRLLSGERENVFVVDLRLERFSGSEENGQRTAYNLLNLVRRQFLLWRNLDPARRAEFIKKGAEMLKTQAIPE